MSRVRIAIYLTEGDSRHDDIIEWMDSFERTTPKNKSQLINRQIINILHDHIIKSNKKSKKESPVKEKIQSVERKKSTPTIKKEVDGNQDNPISIKSQPDILVKNKEGGWAAPPEIREPVSSEVIDLMDGFNFDD